MIGRFAMAVVLSVPASAQPAVYRPSSELPPEVLLLSRIKQRASMDFAHIPNFTCRETIQRFRGHAAKAMKKADTVEVEVANIDNRELYAWPGERRFEERSITEMVGSGLVSDGEYISDAHNALLGGTGRITYRGMDRIAGRDAVAYDFSFSPAFSPYTLMIGEAKAVIGEKGSFWADPVTHTLLRVSFVGTEIPDFLGVRDTTVQIDYGRVRIGDVDALLPVKAMTALTRESGETIRNDIEFTRCRQYTAESVLSAEPPADIISPPLTPPPPGEVVLPLGYDIHIRLTAAIPLASAKVGDPIEAELESDLKVKQKVFVPKGALVAGRIRLLQKLAGESALGLELDEISFGRTRVRFTATLVDAGAAYSVRHARNGRAIVTEGLPEIDGVSILRLPGETHTLRRGMRMEWKIIGAGE